MTVLYSLESSRNVIWSPRVYKYRHMHVLYVEFYLGVGWGETKVFPPTLTPHDLLTTALSFVAIVRTCGH